LEPYVIKLEELGMDDLEVVGGKNASLGEMISNLSNLGVTVPGGFATTAAAYRDFLGAGGLDKKISSVLDTLDIDDIDALTSAGSTIRNWILETPLPDRLMDAVRSSWDEMSEGKDIAVAVRSSATAEDLPDASFAGQQETFLNVRGFDNLVEAMHHVFAHCSMIAPSRTGSTRVSTTARWHYLPAYKRWSVATSAPQAWCLRSTQKPASKTPCSLPRRMASARRSFRAL
jgi:phosphoenolpyruvate synthase/pyruvate phosphate dikinase